MKAPPIRRVPYTRRQYNTVRKLQAHGYPPAIVSERVGLSREIVANIMRHCRRKARLVFSGREG